VIGPVLIANRGEIAVRVARTAHALGLGTAGVFTDADAGAPHVDAVDVAVRVPSYLDGAALLAAARTGGARAVHPGYGFLSENAAFAAAVTEAGLTWIGPPAAAIELMGDKARAKRLARAAGVPVVPGVEGDDVGVGAIRAFGGEQGFPVVIKAVAGGGGKGMRVVRGPDEVEPALDAARREARAAFGRRSRARGALPRAAAAHRGAGARRPPRRRRPSSASASAPCSGATRRWSRRRRRPSSTRSAARAWARPRWPSPRRAGTRARARSSSSRRRTAASSSSSR
jgi:hypothetical protein